MGSILEKKQLQGKSNVMVGITMACVIGFISLTSMGKENDLVMWTSVTLMFVGIVTWFGGLMAYARSKGYSSSIGLLGFLGLVGLLILLFIPDQWRLQAPPVIDPNSNYPRDPNRM